MFQIYIFTLMYANFQMIFLMYFFFTFKERKDSRTFLIIGLIQLLVEADDCFLTKLSLLVFHLMIHYCQEVLNNFLCIHSHENSIRFFNILWYRRIQCLQFQMQMLAQSSTFKPFFSQNYLNGSQLIPQKSYSIKVQIGFSLSPVHFRKRLCQVACIVFFVKPFHQDWRMSQSAIEAKYICFGVFGQSGKSSMR